MKEVGRQLARGGVNQTRSDSGNQPADLYVGIARHVRSRTRGGQADVCGSADESRAALSVERQCERLRSAFVAQLRASRVGALQAGDANPQARFVRVRTDRP